MWEETSYIYLHAIHIPVYLRMQFAFRTLKFPTITAKKWGWSLFILPLFTLYSELANMQFS
jgi:hypothetical protein